tara:strand:+ start:1407 stop:1745 length:339 start_codon:yes stop_codon:yes gene_type:complete
MAEPADVVDWYRGLSEQARLSAKGLLFMNALALLFRVAVREQKWWVVCLKTLFVLMWSSLSVYVLDCAVKGKCNTYAWIAAYMNIFAAAVYFIAVLLAISLRRTKKNRARKR